MNKNRLRVYFSSNAVFSSSGYGQQAAELLPLIRDILEPNSLAICNFYGSQGGKFVLDGILQYPVIQHVYGSDGLVQHAPDFKADVVFTLQDQWVLNPEDLTKIPRWIPICPVDHDPVSKPVLNNLRFAYRVITYSKFGQKQLANNGIFSTYIPHTVNTEIFTPMNNLERKQKAGFPPNSYLVGMVGANKEDPPRKAFQEAMDAFKLFLKKVPNAFLYVHTDNNFPGGFNLRNYADFIGIQDKLLMPDIYQMRFKTDKAAMARIYNTFDMLLAPSISEGFCVPIIEAQSCGIPVVTNNFTAMPELVQEGITGEICDVAYKRFSGQGSYMGIPSVPSIFDKMMKVYNMDRGKTGKACREWILNNYDTHKVFNSLWKPYLAMLEKEVYGEPLALPIKK
jgi:glycosyltransferase involved in cell wall biosynthesis